MRSPFIVLSSAAGTCWPRLPCGPSARPARGQPSTSAPGRRPGRAPGRRRGLRELQRLAVVWLAAISERDLDGPLVGAADDVECDGAALRGMQRVEQVVGGAYRVTRGRHDQVALG